MATMKYADLSYGKYTPETLKAAADTLKNPDSGIGQLVGIYNPGLYAMAYQAAGVATAAPAETPANPVYDKATETFGVLRHVDKVNDTFLQAKRGILELRELLTLKPPGVDKTLMERLSDYVKRYLTEAERAELLAGLGALQVAMEKKASFGLNAVTEKAAGTPFFAAIPNPGEDMEVGKDEAGNPILVKRNEQSALFATGRVMAGDIRFMETLRHALTVIRRRRQLSLAQTQAELARVEGQIPEAARALDALDGQRQEALGDLAVARRLLAEHWMAVEQAWAERRRILDNHLGLYYVRVRETPLSLTLPDPLELRHSDADDLVPGCASETTEIPAVLGPFLEAVYDVPVGDWAALRDLYAWLPERSRIAALVAQRRERLASRQPVTGDGSGLGTRLQPLQQARLALARELVKRPFSTDGALSKVQQQARDLLALDDLLAGPPHRLREPARTLHQRLGNAAACLVQRLRAITPSVRLAWAEQAEDDRLAVEQPERWPGLERAEAADFNGVRTLVELVAWWFRQLHAEAAGASRSALRDYVRACLLHAASDDPAQILRGSVATLPGRFRVGEILRLALNREALPGTLVALLDPEQRVVGTLRVDDHDEQGAVAVVTQVLDPSAAVSTAYRVSGVTKAR